MDDSQKTATSNAPFFVSNEVIRLNRNGVWLSDNTEITHEGTRKLFAKNLKRGQNGFYLQVGAETKPVEVEDTPYFVTRIDGSPQEGYTLTLNDESKESLTPSTLQYRAETHQNRLICKLARGEEARFLQAPYMDLLRWTEEDKNHYFLVIRGERLNLGPKSQIVS